LRIYVDTSVIVKLYFKEPKSRKTASWIKETNEALPLTPFHELEFVNALQLKRFRNEIDHVDVERILSELKDHEHRGVFYRPAIDWSEVFAGALAISQRHTHGIGARSMDIVHVSLALSIGAERFITLDRRQSALAEAEGMDIRFL